MEQPLNEQVSKLQNILSSMRSKQFWQTLPLIDDTKDHDAIEIQEADVPGLRHFKVSIQKEIETIESHLAFEAKNGSSKTLSTNSSYYCALWNEILQAPRPIIAINKVYNVSVPREESLEIIPSTEAKKETSGKAKVDLVAENGRCWIRVNSTKESRLLAEYRSIEAFAYESSDESQSEDADNEPRSNGTKMLPMDNYLDNSVYETGKLLCLAAQQSSMETGYTPMVHLRLSRLDNHSSDKRIVHTIEKLRGLGIIVELGSKEVSVPTSLYQPVPFIMPQNINLDLSLLIALVTDITHAPLPGSREEAEERFKPQTDRSWKRQLDKNSDVTEDAMEHCRALVEQASHEMDHGLVQTIHDRFLNHPHRDKIQFWTTQEAKERCLAIVSKIGGPGERSRAQALFSSDNPQMFWEGSRIPVEQRPNLLPIQVLPDLLPPPDVSTAPACTFHQQLALTCSEILTRPTRQDARADDTEGKLPAPTRFAARLSSHTVKSLLWGAERGMVTLTSNKTSVRLILREMRGFALPSVEENRLRGLESEEGMPMALWIMEPRSLSQGMRSDMQLTDTD